MKMGMLRTYKTENIFYGSRCLIFLKVDRYYMNTDWRGSNTTGV